MSLIRILFLPAILGVVLLALSSFIGCSCGDDVDSASDDDSSGEDDDDTGDEHPCEGIYDVIIQGDYDDDFDWVTTWTTKYVINENDTTEGIVIPDALGWESYEVIGTRTSQGTGFSDGSFPTSQDLETYCFEETVSIHVQYTISDDSFSGEATYKCPDTLGPFAISGKVTCGNP